MDWKSKNFVTSYDLLERHEEYNPDNGIVRNYLANSASQDNPNLPMPPLSRQFISYKWLSYLGALLDISVTPNTSNNFPVASDLTFSAYQPLFVLLPGNPCLMYPAVSSGAPTLITNQKVTIQIIHI